MKRKYWFPAVICPKALDEPGADSKMRSPVIACPKCEHYDGTNTDKEQHTFIVCKYQSSAPSANEVKE